MPEPKKYKKIYGEVSNLLPETHPIIQWIRTDWQSPAESILALSEALEKTYDITLLVEKNPHPARFYISYSIGNVTIYRIYNFVKFREFVVFQRRYKVNILRAVQDLLFRAIFKIYNNNGEIYKSRFAKNKDSFQIARMIDRLHRIYNKRLTSM